MAGPGKVSSNLQKALVKALGSNYVAAMLRHFADMRRSYLSQDWENCCSKAGKFVEALLKGLHFCTTGNRIKSIAVGSEIDRLTNLPKGSFNEWIRLLIPRLCRSLYQIASDRGARHDISGFEPNRMDAEFARSCASFLLAELVRIFHPGKLSPERAQNLAQGLIERSVPLVASVFDVERVLKPDLPYKDQVLLLLYKHHPDAVSVKELQTWLEYKNATDFKRRLLRKLHQERSIELHGDKCALLPPGLKYVEENLLPKFSEGKVTAPPSSLFSDLVKF